MTKLQIGEEGEGPNKLQISQEQYVYKDKENLAWTYTVSQPESFPPLSHAVSDFDIGETYPDTIYLAPLYSDGFKRRDLADYDELKDVGGSQKYTYDEEGNILVDGQWRWNVGGGDSAQAICRTLRYPTIDTEGYVEVDSDDIFMWLKTRRRDEEGRSVGEKIIWNSVIMPDTNLKMFTDIANEITQRSREISGK